LEGEKMSDASLLIFFNAHPYVALAFLMGMLISTVLTVYLVFKYYNLDDIIK